MKIVIPMAGAGKRFADAGFTVPKPLIDVQGKPMYARATDSLPLGQASTLVFICQAQHLADGTLAQDIASRYGKFSPVIVTLDSWTRGQAETVLYAKDLISGDEPLLIYNADTVCTPHLDTTLAKAGGQVDGILGVFRAEGTRWSFARVGSNGRVVETAEKRRISDWASTGLYYFARGDLFVRYATAMIDGGDTTRGEFYVAPIYNQMIVDGADVRIDVATDVGVMGTPEDLEAFLASQRLAKS